jgi:hypothetical protein
MFLLSLDGKLYLGQPFSNNLLDDLADYSEFLFEDSALANSPPAATLVIMVGTNSEKPYHETTTHDATGWQPG